MLTGYFGYARPASWVEVPPRPMTKTEPSYQLPRANPTDPVVTLKEGNGHVEEDAGLGAGAALIARAVDGWAKRLGPVSTRRRTQPVMVHGEGWTRRAPDAPVAFVEHVAEGRAFLGAVVDLTAVDARTMNSYSRVGTLTFELEGPEAMVLAAKPDFEAMVESVGLDAHGPPPEGDE
jgi:hypothetical protein